MRAMAAIIFKGTYAYGTHEISKSIYRVNGSPSVESVQNAGFFDSSAFFRKIPKWIGKTNIIWPHEYEYMVNTFLLLKKYHYICKFHLENGILKMLSKKHIKIVKTPHFSLELFVLVGQTFQWVLVSKNSCGLKNRNSET